MLAQAKAFTYIIKLFSPFFTRQTCEFVSEQEGTQKLQRGQFVLANKLASCDKTRSL